MVCKLYFNFQKRDKGHQKAIHRNLNKKKNKCPSSFKFNDVKIKSGDNISQF